MFRTHHADRLGTEAYTFSTTPYHRVTDKTAGILQNPRGGLQALLISSATSSMAHSTSHRIQFSRLPQTRHADAAMSGDRAVSRKRLGQGGIDSGYKNKSWTRWFSSSEAIFRSDSSPVSHPSFGSGSRSGSIRSARLQPRSKSSFTSRTTEWTSSRPSIRRWSSAASKSWSGLKLKPKPVPERSLEFSRKSSQNFGKEGSFDGLISSQGQTLR